MSEHKKRQTGEGEKRRETVQLRKESRSRSESVTLSNYCFGSCPVFFNFATVPVSHSLGPSGLCVHTEAF